MEKDTVTPPKNYDKEQEVMSSITLHLSDLFDKCEQLYRIIEKAEWYHASLDSKLNWCWISILKSELRTIGRTLGREIELIETRQLDGW